MVGPSLSKDERCILLNMFTATEAFLGVLYAGFAGAVILGKIMRYNKVAAVIFSDPIVVRFGSGVQIEHMDRSRTAGHTAGVPRTRLTTTKEKRNSLESDDDDDDDASAPIPYPVLEFRLANVAFARHGGEIANAHVQVWTSTSAEIANESVKDAADMSGSTGALRRRRQQILERRLLDQQMLERQQHKQGLSLSVIAGSGANAAGSIIKTVGGTVSMAAKTVTGTVGKAGKTVTSTVSMANRATKSIGGLVLQVASSPVAMVNKPANALDDKSRKSSNTEFDDSAHDPDGLYQPSDKVESTSSSVPAKNVNGEMPRYNGVAHSTFVSDSVLEGRSQEADDFVDPDLAIQLASIVGNSTRAVAMLEDPPDNGVSHATIYSRLELENDSHPFFKHLWTLRHKIDATSPLLDARGHEILQAHLREKHAAAAAGTDRRAARVAAEGSWPPSLNSWEALRRHIQFKEIMVTLTGTDHITGNTVYSHTKYTLADMAIGWRFANMLRKDPDGSLGVDLGLINDVLEQVGGGGEPLEVPELDGGNPHDRVDVSGWGLGGFGDIENQRPKEATQQTDDNLGSDTKEN